MSTSEEARFKILSLVVALSQTTEIDIILERANRLYQWVHEGAQK